ncbi:hypothetical protein J4468_04540 [Candidatus Woesearchaeota archaeon]|nr:hypothetical protein [Candidatus Woesearchaeota archaeon]
MNDDMLFGILKKSVEMYDLEREKQIRERSADDLETQVMNYIQPTTFGSKESLSDYIKGVLKDVNEENYDESIADKVLSRLYDKLENGEIDVQVSNVDLFKYALKKGAIKSAYIVLGQLTDNLQDRLSKYIEWYDWKEASRIASIFNVSVGAIIPAYIVKSYIPFPDGATSVEKISWSMLIGFITGSITCFLEVEIRPKGPGCSLPGLFLSLPIEAGLYFKNYIKSKKEKLRKNKIKAGLKEIIGDLEDIKLLD